MNHSTSDAGRGAGSASSTHLARLAIAVLALLLAACSAEAPSPCEVRAQAVCDVIADCPSVHLQESRQEYMAWCVSYETGACRPDTSMEVAVQCVEDVAYESCDSVHDGLFTGACAQLPYASLKGPF